MRGKGKTVVAQHREVVRPSQPHTAPEGQSITLALGLPLGLLLSARPCSRLVGEDPSQEAGSSSDRPLVTAHCGTSRGWETIRAGL